MLIVERGFIMRKTIEKEYLKSIKERIGSTVYTPRICSSIGWYVSRAKLYKSLYYILNLTAIFIPIIGSVAAIIMDKAWLSLFTAISSACVTMLSLFECQNRWKLYRVTAEKLKNVVELYLAKQCTYDEFVLECEKIMTEEDVSWQKMLEKDANDRGEKKY